MSTSGRSMRPLRDRPRATSVAFSFLLYLLLMKSTAHDTQINGTTIHYWTYGNPTAAPVLVVHGFRGTHHGLEYVIDNLQGDHHVIVPDLPGFGDSPAFSDIEHTIANYALVLTDFLKKLGINKTYILGHSMGTVIAAEMIKQQPKRFTKAVLINPVAKKPPVLQLFPGYLYHRLAGKYLPEKLGTAVLSNKQLFLLGSAVMTKTKDKKLRKLIHWNHTTYMKRFAHRTSLLEAFESANSTALEHYVEHLNLPVLMIAGKQDTIAPVKDARNIAGQLKDVELVEFDRVGHIIHYERPKEAAAAIDAFLL